jgi:glycerol uptake facilitator-like aquaporin
MKSPFFGEFIGTMPLVFLGDGSVAIVLLGKSKAQGAGWGIYRCRMDLRRHGGRLAS